MVSIFSYVYLQDRHEFSDLFRKTWGTQLAQSNLPINARTCIKTVVACLCAACTVMSDYELDDGMRKDLATVLNINIYVNVCILNEHRHHHHESPVWLSASHAQLVASVHGEH